MLTNAQLLQAFHEAEARKSDNSLPLDVRIRSAETCALCLRAAADRGYTYSTLKAAVERGE